MIPRDAGEGGNMGTRSTKSHHPERDDVMQAGEPSNQNENRPKRLDAPMNLTAYHAKLFAHELTKRSSSASVDSLTSALADAQVDLNPHQVEAALFALPAPVSRGAILADEVGLGKTIEAGILPLTALGRAPSSPACYLSGEPSKAVGARAC